MHTKRYTPSDINRYLDEYPVYSTGGKTPVRYLNVPCVFDIETTSFYENAITHETRHDTDGVDDPEEWEKRATMYAWVFGINGRCFTGRTWRSFVTLMHKVSKRYELSKDKRLIVYCHNLSFEFQWLRHYFNWESVFALEERKPVKAVTKIGIEFRCSMTLSGYSLAKVGEQLHTYKVSKLVGDLDYNEFRHCKTPLTEKEWGYIVHDGLVVMAYIQELLDQRKRITRIPLTKTGFVREEVRNKCFWSGSSHSRDKTGKFLAYKTLMSNLTLNGVEEYTLLKRAFHGGFVHANFNNANRVLSNIASYDFTSSYPAVIVSEKFPMSKGLKVMPKSEAEFRRYLDLYLCVFEATFTHVESIVEYDHVISVSRCLSIDAYDEDNGRVIDAERLTLCLTNIDLETYSHFYRWKTMSVRLMYVYKAQYLPTDFVGAVLDFYEKKTLLKGVPGKEAEYLWGKENVNACFGMSVTDICRNGITYNDEKEWGSEPCDYEKTIQEYNQKPNRFLSYAWGVFITAYAMRNLCSGIVAVGESGDYCYSDTDSVKIMHRERHLAYFEEYNKLMVEKLRKACAYHGFDFSRCSPKTIKGEEKTLGVWDYEGTYKRAKFLGAKRYAVEFDDGTHSITISGVNKHVAVPALERKAEKMGKDFFDFINFDYTFERDECGKLLHTYVDEPKKGVLRDYRGVPCKYAEQSFVHLEPTTYNLSVTKTYLDLLMSVSVTDWELPG